MLRRKGNERIKEVMMKKNVKMIVAFIKSDKGID